MLFIADFEIVWLYFIESKAAVPEGSLDIIKPGLFKLEVRRWAELGSGPDIQKLNPELINQAAPDSLMYSKLSPSHRHQR